MRWYGGESFLRSVAVDGISLIMERMLDLFAGSVQVLENQTLSFAWLSTEWVPFRSERAARYITFVSIFWRKIIVSVIPFCGSSLLTPVGCFFMGFRVCSVWSLTESGSKWPCVSFEALRDLDA
jgi:hypothetical protein